MANVDDGMEIHLETEKVCGTCLETMDRKGQGNFECGKCHIKFSE